MIQIMTGAEPFFFPGGRTGCLLVHGFTGTPKEMRSLGEHLARQGLTVLGPRLFGHCTRMEDLYRARWWDWYGSVEDGFHLLRGGCDQVFVMGLSMGGVLSLILAARQPVAGVVPMSTPYDPPDARMNPVLMTVLPVLTLVWRQAAKGPSDWRDPKAAADHLEYPAHAVRGGAEVFRLLIEMRRCLPSIKAPALVMASRGDATVTPPHAQAIYDHLGSTDKTLLFVENSGHVITRDAEREKVFAAAAEFVRRVSGTKP
jgi:carboxylesterase